MNLSSQSVLFSSNDKEYLSNELLVLIFSLIAFCNSAFLFSIARNRANNPIDNKNQGEKSKLDAFTPAIALIKKPDETQNISIIGSFFNFKQYKIWIKKYKIIIKGLFY